MDLDVRYSVIQVAGKGTRLWLSPANYSFDREKDKARIS